MPDLNGKISQAEFIRKMKELNPALKPFPDAAIMERVLKEDPTVRDKVYTPDDVAASAQARLEQAARSGYVAPKSLTDFWGAHPNIKALAKGTVDTLPGIGTMVGGALATPETLGLGTVGGMMVGGGAGKGVRDYIAESVGLEPTSGSLHKIGSIAEDTALSGIIPGLTDAALNPSRTLRLIAGDTKGLPTAVLPKWAQPPLLQRISDAMGRFAEGGNPALDPRVRPSWQHPSEFPPDTFKPDIPPSTPTILGTDLPLPSAGPRDMSVPGRPPIFGSSGTGMSSDFPLPGEPRPSSVPSSEPRPTGSTRTPWGSDVPLSEQSGNRYSMNVPEGEGIPEAPAKGSKRGRPIIQILTDQPGVIKKSIDEGKTWKISTDNGKTWAKYTPGEE